MDLEKKMPQLQRSLAALVQNIGKVIVGKDAEIMLALTAPLGGGHVILEDYPGTGKTMFARALAKSVHGEFKRIQCMPDLLPTDITGYMRYNRKTGEDEFKAGPIFANIVLADELNRATPKTQAAFLEALGEEKQVTIDGITYDLPHPFFLVATENPVEFEGTFPLPEAQLDRFFIRMSFGYPELSDLVAIVQQQNIVHPIRTLEPVIELADILELQEAVKHVYVDHAIDVFVAKIVYITQRLQEYPDICKRVADELGEDLGDDPPLSLGSSTRGAETLHRAAQVTAFFNGRDYVVPDDVREMAVPTLNHRVKLSGAALGSDDFLRMRIAETVIKAIVEAIHDPPSQQWHKSS